MAKDWLRYDRMVQDAMRGVVREALREVAEKGFPGNHHFYITFQTEHPDTDVPERLRSAYPEEMTIVLQNQFFGLEVDEAGFAVTLSFNKALERLRVPFAAVTAFVDPGVNFGLQFQADGAAPPAPPATAPAAPAAAAGTPAEPEAPAEKIVSLDAFRKR